MDKTKTIIILAIGVLLLGVLSIVQYQEIRTYETNFTMTQEEIELNNCPICESDNITINPVNSSFYIECGGCHLKTTYFNSLIKMIEYWNGKEVN